jgi:ketosteroid isomerase-like protein
MGRARELWDQLGAALEKQDVEGLVDLYATESTYLEPQNPPHEGNLLIQAYLSSWLQARGDISVTTARLLESDDGLTVAVEWTVSYTAGGRRWNNLPRASWFECDDEGIRYHRDYY